MKRFSLHMVVLLCLFCLAGCSSDPLKHVSEGGSGEDRSVPRWTMPRTKDAILLK